MAPEDVIGSRAFSAADQHGFARLSGDSNPMHVDEARARRTMAGAPVVHGVHGVLWALEELGRAGVPLAAITTLKVQFAKFVYLDQEISLRIARRSDLALKAELVTNGGSSTSLTLKFGEPRPGIFAEIQGHPENAHLGVPKNPTLEELQGLEGRLMSPPDDELRRRFPTLCGALGDNRVQSLALLSTLVGMVCPGLHSIFGGFEVEFLAEEMPASLLSWRAVRVDERFRRVAMEVRGAGFEGEVQAFVRPEPIEPPRMADLAKRVSTGEFSGRTALVVGGARGLGAVTAKLLAAGGAHVVVTYATGREEAEALVADVSAVGGTASALHCDVTGNVAEDLDDIKGDITHVYYFATPRIGQDKAKIFAHDRFDVFVRFYVDGFLKTVNGLASERGSALKSIFYPSTIFVNDRPRGMTEYAMAKAAGEILARDLAAALGIHVSIPRIPKLLTDQTSGLTPLDVADSVDVMLPLLRNENSTSITRSGR